VTDRIPLTVDRLREIALEGFEEGARTARARREAAGFAPLPHVEGVQTLGEVIRTHLPELLSSLIREDEDLSPRQADERCGRCDGAGWVVQRLTDGTIQTAPPVVQCAVCLGYRRAPDAEALAAQAGITRRQRTKTFSNFRPAPGSEAALFAVTKWATEDAVTDEIGARTWLVVGGAGGCGKTHLSLAAANLLSDLGLAVRWVYTADIVDQARSLYGGDGGEDKVLAFRRELAHVPILIMDEFGSLGSAPTSATKPANGRGGCRDPRRDRGGRSHLPALRGDHPRRHGSLTWQQSQPRRT
jgi:DNA replication protein DnaC